MKTFNLENKLNYGIVHINGCRGDKDKTTQKHKLSSIVSNFPHDPNLIVPLCKDLNRSKDINAIPYRIYFQNDGKDPAKNIRVTFRTDLNYTNIRLLDSSFQPVQMTWNRFNPGSQSDPNALFYFYNIYLPGMGQIPPPLTVDETIGWVDFLVCYDITKLPEKGCIHSEIDIYFDNEEPVYADTELCERQLAHQNNDDICYTIECPIKRLPFQQDLSKILARNRESNHSVVSELKVYPNPATNSITIEGLDQLDNTTLTVVDIHNRVMKSGRLNKQVDISNLPPGVYNIILQSDSTIKVKQFVKL